MRAWCGFTRGALLALCMWPSTALALEITDARYAGATELYGHLVLGKDHNWSELVVTLSDGSAQRVIWTTMVFEDTAPRLVDMSGDGAPEIMVVEAIPGQGARVAFYGLREDRVVLLAHTPFIGTNNRWYAPVGAADLDGDGVMEFAFVDRPHLARILRVWRYETGPGAVVLREIATMQQATNHKIGEDWISGGIRECGQGPEMIVASANWAKVMAVTLQQNATLQDKTLSFDATRAGFATVMACEE